MLRLTYQDIIKLNPCNNHHPSKYITEEWEGTICQLLELPNVAPKEKLWVALQFLNNKTLRLFAADCARRALALAPNPDPRSIEACNVAERFALGQASIKELVDAYDAARVTYAAAAYAAAEADAAARAAAAYAAADAAAYAAYAGAAAAYAGAAAAYAGAAAAYAAADAAARVAAAYAGAAYAAADAAYAGARLNEMKLQILRLITIIEEQEILR